MRRPIHLSFIVSVLSLTIAGSLPRSTERGVIIIFLGLFLFVYLIHSIGLWYYILGKERSTRLVITDYAYILINCLFIVFAILNIFFTN